MSSSLTRVGLFVLAILAIFVYLGEKLTEMSGGGMTGASAASGEVSPEAGEALFLGKGKCYTCHSVGEKGSSIRGPNLGELGPLGIPIGERAVLRAVERGGATGDVYSATDYLLESLTEPNAYVVEGYKGEMPVIIRPPIALAPQEVQSVVTYLYSLGGEDAGPRIEQSPFWDRLTAAAAEGAGAEVFEPYLSGDPDKGRTIFFSDRGTCGTCHQVNGEGGLVGPDLSDVAATRSLKYIVESIVDPGAQIASGYERTTITLLDWNEIIGVVRKDTEEAVEIVDAAGELFTVLRDEIDEIVVDEGSPMPANFAELITLAEFHDLLAYLSTLTGE